MNLDKKELVVFDVDGVILDTVPHIVDAMNEICNQMGCIVDEEFIRSQVGNYNFPKLLFPDSIENEKKAYEIYKKEFQEDIHTPKLITGAYETLTEISNMEKNIAFFSSKSKANIQRAVKYHNITDLVNVILGRECVTKHKPNPEGLLQLMESFSCEVTKIIMIGDSLSDFEAANAAGVDFIGVNTGVCTKKDWENKGIGYVDSIKNLI